MKTFKAKNIVEYINLIKRHSYSTFVYRGHANHEWDLIPSLLRIERASRARQWNYLEKNIIREFKKASQPFLRYQPKNEIEWLTIAQHHGIPTRLLDWTKSALIGLYFACIDENESKDGMVWAHDPLIYYNDLTEIKDIDSVGFLHPYMISDRMVNQQGCFSIQPLPPDGEYSYTFDTIMEGHGAEEYFFKIRIQRNSKKQLIHDLDNLGINQASIYPGLDGIGKTLKRRLLLGQI